MNSPSPELLPSPLGTETHPVYQPIVSLSAGIVVGYEALTRPPHGSRWASPESMFVAADHHDDTVEFDWHCRLRALQVALAAGVPSDVAVFVNAEPVALDAPPPAAGLPLLAAARDMSVVIEITERHLMRDPAGLLRAVAHARDLGWRVAVDDVGSDSSSLALLALLRPDVIKLDMLLVQQYQARDSSSILAAVAAESERTGAVVVAEGIENETHARWARDIGASWGQGWLYGGPSDLPLFEPGGNRGDGRLAEPAVTVRAPTAVTPYALTRTRGPARRGDDPLLLSLEHEMLARAAALGPTAVVLATVPATVQVPEALRHVSAGTALTAVFRPGTADGHRSGVRWVEIGADEPLAMERSLVVVDPHFSAALIAVDRGYDDTGSRIFDYSVTYDSDLVLDAATVLMSRIPALAES